MMQEIATWAMWIAVGVNVWSAYTYLKARRTSLKLIQEAEILLIKISQDFEGLSPEAEIALKEMEERNENTKLHTSGNSLSRKLRER
jgi:hypothetical protein